MVKRLSPSEYAMIIALREQKCSLKSIGRKIGCSISAVSKTISRFETTGSPLPRERIAKRKLLSSKDDSYLKLCAKRDRRKSLNAITQEFNIGRRSINLKQVSKSTVRRSLLSMKMRGCVAVKKPFLRPANIKKRLAFAKKHLNWTAEQWSRVLWTDESKFEMFGNKRRLYVRREPNERFKSNCLVPTVKHGGGSVMVWGGMCSSGVVPLYRIKGIMDQKVYHSILIHHVVPGGLKLIGNGFILQQDNDPKHTAKLNTNYVATKEKQGKSSAKQLF